MSKHGDSALNPASLSTPRRGWSAQVGAGAAGCALRDAPKGASAQIGDSYRIKSLSALSLASMLKVVGVRAVWGGGVHPSRRAQGGTPQDEGIWWAFKRRRRRLSISRPPPQRHGVGAPSPHPERPAARAPFAAPDSGLSRTPTPAPPHKGEGEARAAHHGSQRSAPPPMQLFPRHKWAGPTPTPAPPHKGERNSCARDQPLICRSRAWPSVRRS